LPKATQPFLAAWKRQDHVFRLHVLVHLRANIDNIDPILPLGIILPQMNANQRKLVEIDCS